MRRAQAERDAEFAAQAARATARAPGAPQYRAMIATLFKVAGPAVNAPVTRWGAVNVATGEPLAVEGATGRAEVSVPVAGGGTSRYRMAGGDGKPTPRLADDLDDLFGWVRDLPGGGILHIGRQWYDLRPRRP